MRFALYALRRLGRLLLTVLVMASLVFVVLRIIPGDPAAAVAGIDAEEEDVRALRRSMGLEGPLGRQYLSWLWDVLRLDLGVSLTSSRTVAGLIGDRFPLTLSLAVFGLGVAVAVGVPLGVLSAIRRWRAADYAAMAVSHSLMSVPSFWLGILLLLLFSVRLRWFPLFGSGSFAHLVLPALALGLSRGAVLTRVVRASVIEELAKEYVVTARAKGLREYVVRYRHALRNALLPVITLAGLQFGYMLGGAIVIEQVFSLPGLGRLFLSAIYQRDFPLVQGGVVFVALVFSGVNFVVDLAYSIVDPRIRAA
jgi:peptide/nickel transport system permease protein